MNDVLAEWKRFFCLGGAAASERRFRVVRRRGEPLLLLPVDARAATLSLDFYPAQTALAKAARAALRWALRARIPLSLDILRLPWDDSAPLPAFLREQAGAVTPEIGILLGNPRAEGRRWIIGVILGGKVLRVVKAGVTTRARELIAAEAECLSALPSTLAAVPKLRGKLDGNVAALALDYAPGVTPSGNTGREISAVLTTWLDVRRDVALADVPAWQRVCASSAEPKSVTRVGEELGAAPFAATVMHGDFAPWNIRDANGNWTVLDWERGEMIGVPGWDWLHYAIQSDVLVARRDAGEVVARTQSMMRGGDFQDFANRAKIAGRERALLAGYLLHAVHVVRQTEGIETMRRMLHLVEQGI